ncbi:MAG: hypothetical protein ACI3XR_03560 [Eubacteriales bacterium]
MTEVKSLSPMLGFVPDEVPAHSVSRQGGHICFSSSRKRMSVAKD